MKLHWYKFKDHLKDPKMYSDTLLENESILNIVNLKLMDMLVSSKFLVPYNKLMTIFYPKLLLLKP